jgi:hypothetical protein
MANCQLQTYASGSLSYRSQAECRDLMRSHLIRCMESGSARQVGESVFGLRCAFVLAGAKTTVGIGTKLGYNDF